MKARGRPPTAPLLFETLPPQLAPSRLLTDKHALEICAACSGLGRCTQADKPRVRCAACNGAGVRLQPIGESSMTAGAARRTSERVHELLTGTRPVLDDVQVSIKTR